MTVDVQQGTREGTAAVEFGELPKTSTGKIQKFLLRQKEWEGQQKRIH